MPEHHRIELRPPDIAPYRRGNAGADYVHVFDSGKPGPAVMVQALTHGNEICGAIALDWLFKEKLSPLQGKLILAFANVEAFRRFDYDDPDRSRYVDEDYNRVWSDEALGSGRDSVELRRARELRPFVDAADLLLDLHSMHEPCRPIMVCGVEEKGGAKAVALSRRLGVPGDLLLDTGHPAGLRMIERGGFGDPRSAKTAILIECGQHWEKSAADVAIDTLVRFLSVAGTAPRDWAEKRVRAAPKEQKVIRVTEAVVAKTGAFRFSAAFKGLEVLPKKGSVVATDGEHTWRTPYDDCVMVMPSLRHLKPGTTMVRLGRFA
ncbi:MAG TPA: succinylglutamate desuccinylase/aspartoacylase family protein [Burkholderiales bacterium]|nr:succinylglutamate desuccinylase/aspartoacylase family protein [Burkholderiales bacterium]